MREFTVMFRSVQELSEFMALANQQPFDVLFVRAGGVSNAKSMFSCLSVKLNTPPPLLFVYNAAFCLASPAGVASAVCAEVGGVKLKLLNSLQTPQSAVLP